MTKDPSSSTPSPSLPASWQRQGGGWQPPWSLWHRVRNHTAAALPGGPTSSQEVKPRFRGPSATEPDQGFGSHVAKGSTNRSLPFPAVTALPCAAALHILTNDPRQQQGPHPQHTQADLPLYDEDRRDPFRCPRQLGVSHTGPWCQDSRRKARAHCSAVRTDLHPVSWGLPLGLKPPEPPASRGSCRLCRGQQGQEGQEAHRRRETAELGKARAVPRVPAPGTLADYTE